MNLLAGLAAFGVVLLVTPAPPRLRRSAEVGQPNEPPRGHWMHRWRWLLAAMAGVGGFLFVGGRMAPVAAVAAGCVAWWVIGRT